MTKVCYLLVLSILFAFLSSCDSDTSELENMEAREVFTIGETKNADSQKGIVILPLDCGVTGPICAYPNQTLTYTYSSPDINPAITWTVDSGSITIVSGQGTNTVTFNFGSDFSGGTITVVGVGPLNCTVTINILSCGIPPVDCTTYSLGILDEYLDGTQGGADIVYLHAGGNFPAGTTYAWTIKRQDGSTQFYSASTSNPRQVVASINNRITQATVTAEFEDCTRTVTNTFICAIPNADINGNLFPECNGLGSNGGFGRVK